MVRVKKLISRTAFAKLAGVSPAAITGLCKPGKRLESATEGKRINATHSAALEYVNSRRAVNGGRDPLYRAALEFCIDEGKFTVVGLERRFGIGNRRARKIRDDIREAGVLPARPPAGRKRPPGRGPDPVRTPPPDDSGAPVGFDSESVDGGAPGTAPHRRGRAAARDQKKLETPPELGSPEFEVPEHLEEFAEMTLRKLIEIYGTDQRFLDWLASLQKIETINEKRIKNAERMGDLVNRDLMRHAVIEPFNACHLRLLQDGAQSITVDVVAKHTAGKTVVEIVEHVSNLIGSFIKPAKSQISRNLRKLDK